ncbi:MAG: hypothetical protein ACRCWR_03555 [Saezia sp.]
MKDFLPLLMEYEDFAFASLICAIACYLILRIGAALKEINSWLWDTPPHPLQMNNTHSKNVLP